jgi:hypothetical protein
LWFAPTASGESKIVLIALEMLNDWVICGAAL